ncbi:C-type lectin domain family 4 member A-like [Palaemon carinicauda]|uniref:C-type lectin domain family 4 member A-like n=1 Tax=Palaemon carinicauda TaxID=392227 RepID=UPI0035B62E3C
MEKYFVLLYFTTVFIGTCTAYCQDPFIELGRSCYYFSVEESTWTAARASCKGMSFSESVDLAVFERNCGDYISVINYVSDLGSTIWWIGGSDDEHEGYWEWVDRRPINMIRDYWSPDEPSSTEGENSLILFRTNETLPRWRVGDHVSTDIQRYICQTSE